MWEVFPQWDFIGTVSRITASWNYVVWCHDLIWGKKHKLQISCLKHQYFFHTNMSNEYYFHTNTFNVRLQQVHVKHYFITLVNMSTRLRYLSYCSYKLYKFMLFIFWIVCTRQCVWVCECVFVVNFIGNVCGGVSAKWNSMDVYEWAMNRNFSWKEFYNLLGPNRL